MSFSIIKWSQADSGVEYLIGRLDGVFISPTQRVMSIGRGTCWTLSGEWLRLSLYPSIKSQSNKMEFFLNEAELSLNSVNLINH